MLVLVVAALPFSKTLITSRNESRLASSSASDSVATLAAILVESRQTRGIAAMPLERLAAIPTRRMRHANCVAISTLVTQSRFSSPANPPFGRPLRVMFMQTDMRIGGAEMVTANIIRRLDRERFAPELCCLKERGPLGEALADEIPVHHEFAGRQVRSARLAAAGSPVASPANRCGHHRRRRRQNVLGPVGRAARWACPSSSRPCTARAGPTASAGSTEC